MAVIKEAVHAARVAVPAFRYLRHAPKDRISVDERAIALGATQGRAGVSGCCVTMDRRCAIRVCPQGVVGLPSEVCHVWPHSRHM